MRSKDLLWVRTASRWGTVRWNSGLQRAKALKTHICDDKHYVTINMRIAGPCCSTRKESKTSSEQMLQYDAVCYSFAPALFSGWGPICTCLTRINLLVQQLTHTNIHNLEHA